MNNLRNPDLYAILQQLYGQVRIQNPGQAYRYKAVRHGGLCDITRVFGGEEYSACCPKCGDTKYRLTVNHIFGTQLEGQPMKHVAHCWNEDCEVQEEIYNAILTGGGSKILGGEPVEGPVSVELIAQESNERFTRLRDLTRIDQLPIAHRAVQYLESRGFDINVLGNYYQVAYCNDMSPRVRNAKGRIIFPMFFTLNGQRTVVGWQARAVPGLSATDTPKYWTSPGCMRSHFLYLFDWAVAANTGVILVEGPTDALTIGPPCMATLGKSLTQRQIALIVSRWGRSSYPIILIGDPGFEADLEKNYESLIYQLGPSEVDRVIKLTPEADSNTLGNAEIVRRIRDACKERGLPSPV